MHYVVASADLHALRVVKRAHCPYVNPGSSGSAAEALRDAVDSRFALGFGVLVELRLSSLRKAWKRGAWLLRGKRPNFIGQYRRAFRASVPPRPGSILLSLLRGSARAPPNMFCAALRTNPAEYVDVCHCPKSERAITEAHTHTHTHSHTHALMDISISRWMFARACVRPLEYMLRIYIYIYIYTCGYSFDESSTHSEIAGYVMSR